MGSRPGRSRSGGIRASTLLQGRERLLPWLAATAVVGGLNLAAVLLGRPLDTPEGTTLLIGLGATLTGTCLVAARSKRAVDESLRDERARPASEELMALDASRATAHEEPDYVSGMERWTSSLLTLLQHASEVAEEPTVRDDLASAVQDTRALRDLLLASEHRTLSLNEMANLHSVCSLWETDQERIERLAEQVDPAWYRRWRARSIIERRLRHGSPERPEVELPYRS